MHRRHTRLTLVALLAALTAQRAARAQVTPSARVSSATPPPSLAPTRVTLEMEPNMRRIAGSRFVVGGRRAERTAEGWAFSQEMTRGLAAAVETATGWVFVTSDGLVAASDRFTGSLRTVGRCLGLASPLSRGRVAIMAEDGLWTSDGRTLTHHETPAPVLYAAFADERRGAATTTEGELMTTQDGGATWSFVRDGTDPWFAVIGKDCGFVAVTARSMVSLRADGARGDPACASGATPPEAAQRAEPTDGEVLEAWRRRYGTRVTRGEVRLRDGSTLRLDEGTERPALVRRDADGQERSRRPLPFVGDLEAWGSTALLRSGGDLWRTADGVSLELILAPDGLCRDANLSRVQTADDGVHLATDRCFYDGLAWREMDLPAWEAWELKAVRGTRALLASVEERGTREWWVSDLNTGGSARVGPIGESSPSNCEFTLSADGVPVGLCGAGDPAGAGPTTLVIGRAGSTMMSRPVPARARRVAFADARRGVATGTRAADLWRTLDGGERWEPVSLPVEGDAGQTEYNTRGFHVGCDAEGCSVGPFGQASVRLSGWGPITVSDERLIFGTAPRGDALVTALVTLRCAADTPRSVSARRDFEPWNRGFCQTIEGRGRRGGALVWEDVGGSSGRISQTRGGDCRDFIAPTRDGGLFVADGLVFRGRGAVRELRHRFDAILGERARFFRDEPITATTARGGAVVHLRPVVFPMENLDLGVRLVTEVDAHGAVLTARVFPGSEFDRATGIALHRGRWGYVTVLPDRTARFAPLGEGEPVTLGRVPAALAPCAGPPARDTTTAHLASTGTGPFVATSGHYLGEERHHRLVVEFAGASVCLRALRSVSRDGALSLAAEQGNLVGSLTSTSDQGAVRCEVTR